MSWFIDLINSSTAEVNSDLWSDISFSNSLPAYVGGITLTYTDSNDVEQTKEITAITKGTTSAVFTIAGHGMTTNTLNVNNRVTFTLTSSNPVDYKNVILTYGSIFSVRTIIDTDTFYIEYLNEDMLGDTCSIHCLGCQPSLLDESVEIKYWGGGYRKMKKARLQFKIKIAGYQTRGNWSDTYNGQENYWKLQKVLQGNNIFILDVGSNFERIFELMLDYPIEFKLPIAVEIFEYGELAAVFEDNKDELSITLVSKEWFLFQ